jgi:hypothetical protein
VAAKHPGGTDAVQNLVGKKRGGRVLKKYLEENKVRTIQESRLWDCWDQY